MARKVKKARGATKRTPAINQAALTKGELRKLNALRKSVGDKIAEQAFSMWLKSKPKAGGGTQGPQRRAGHRDAGQPGPEQRPQDSPWRLRCYAWSWPGDRDASEGLRAASGFSQPPERLSKRFFLSIN